MLSIVEKIRQDLKESSDEKVRQTSAKFFKEDIVCYGVRTNVVTGIGKKYLQSLKGSTKQEIFNVCELMWESKYIEESFIACQWSYSLHKQYKPEDFIVFEKWVIKYVNNWASCDTFCNHTVGEFMEMYPEYLSELKKWAMSENRWLRRASAVSLIVPAKKGKFLNDIFEIADILLLDTDDMVQKGYGWMLKVASLNHQNEVYEYVFSKKAIMPRTALRYAIEKMPSELKANAMKK